MRLHFGELGKALIERGLELCEFGPELGVFIGKREVLLLQEGAGLLGGDGSGVILRLNGVQLRVQISDECVGLLRHPSGVVSVARELLVGDEERHRVLYQLCLVKVLP